MPQVEHFEYEIETVSQRFLVASTYLRPKLARNPNTAGETDPRSRRRTISFGSWIAFAMILSLTSSLLFLVLLQIRRHGFHCFIPLDLTA